ncbi:hypothetical protein DRO64_07480 [Candidatus Bathyarchaeota archaeon]|nr:MAG: hypothetical protein DRO64_07480 [Candidatus Bathyarchaeota archaeon]
MRLLAVSLSAVNSLITEITEFFSFFLYDFQVIPRVSHNIWVTLSKLEKKGYIKKEKYGKKTVLWQVKDP